MSDEINWLVTVLLGDTLVKCALRVKRADLPGDCELYPMEPENRRTVRSLLPEHVRAGGRVVGVEEIFAVHVPGETHADSGSGIVLHRVEEVVRAALALGYETYPTAQEIMMALHGWHVLMFRAGCAGWVRDLIVKWRGKTPHTREQACGIARALVRNADGVTIIPPHGPVYPGAKKGARKTVGDIRQMLDDPLIRDAWPFTVCTGADGQEYGVSRHEVWQERGGEVRLCLYGREKTETRDKEAFDLGLHRLVLWEKTEG